MANASDLEASHDDQIPLDPLSGGELDPAQKALADALRVSFLILKIIMAGLVIYYVFIHPLFTVANNEKAVRLRFGHIVEQNITEGGPHFAWPYPIEEVIKINVSPRLVRLQRQFWFEPDPGASMLTGGEI